ncbi:TPA: hypothetical protein HA244_03515 [Candidatus Micrarchaeota archaeon]|nr:hypothetical protein [Candidatus Micrarchaeota archaeon]
MTENWFSSASEFLGTIQTTTYVLFQTAFDFVFGLSWAGDEQTLALIALALLFLFVRG